MQIPNTCISELAKSKVLLKIKRIKYLASHIRNRAKCILDAKSDDCWVRACIAISICSLQV